MFLLPLLIACGDKDDSYDSATHAQSNGGYGLEDESYENDTDNDEGFADTGAAAEPDNDDGLGSETEDASPILLPATTNQFVFVANPDRNTVTRIDVEELTVITAEVGRNPILVETSSDYSKAISFNAESDSISIIDAVSMDVRNVDIRADLNQMKLSPDGKWVICYHDLNAEEGGSSSGGAISFNAISIVNLETFEHTEAVVGSHPHDVQFTEDSSLAVVIADDYLATIDFTQENPNPSRIAIANDLINPPKAEEVLLDPAGRYALVRQYAVDQLVLVDLQTNVVSMLDVGANPTDMDVSADGSQAFVVARVDKEIWIYDLEDPTITPEVLPLPEDEVFGSLLLSPSGAQGILFSTVSGESKIGIWDRNTNEITIRGLVKPISGVEINPTSDTAIVFHPQENGDIDSSSQFYNKFGISLVDMEDLFSSAYQLVSEPISFAHTPDGKLGFYTMENMPYLEILDYQTFVPNEIQLPSNPVHLGSLPDTNTVFVSQEHHLGRISFYNSDEEKLQTITGFELNSAIEQ